MTMEIDIDPQYYVDVVLRHWKVVIVVFLVATLAAGAASFVQQPTYEATVILTEETYEFYAVPRLYSLDKAVVKLYPTMASTESVESRVIEVLGSSLSATEQSPGVLRSAVTVHEDPENPALFRIRVRGNDPQKAVLIANTWAEQYVEEVSNIPVARSPQLEAAEEDLDSAEAALTEFRQRTGLGLSGLIDETGVFDVFVTLGPAGMQLEKKLDLLAEHRQVQDNLELVLESAQAAQDTGGSIDDLPLQLLSHWIISDRGQLSADVVKDQESLDQVIQLLRSEEQAISGVIDQLASDADALQEGLARDQQELDRLIRSRDLAEGVYEALVSEVQESTLLRTNSQILSRATAARRLDPSAKLSVVLGAALGLAGGVVATFLVEYFEVLRKKRSVHSQ
jgi:uncharacterized protein involved in exopolysaccharide biosynthesis